MSRPVPLCLLALALAAVGCVPPPVAPRTAPSVAIEPDEELLWRAVAEAEKSLADGGRLHGDPGLDAYLLGVARRLQPPEVLAATPFRVRVLDSAEPNAFALPNGAIYLHAGLLARMESEAELAAVLGHEMAHVTHRDGLRTLRHLEDWTSGIGLVRLASVTGDSREHEREADREAIARMQAAGYDVRDAATLLERLGAWVAAEGGKDVATPYSSHPRLAERLESCRALIAAAGPVAGTRNAEEFTRRTAGLLLENARIELAAGRYPDARAQGQRYLALAPGDASAHLLLGEIARREGTPAANDEAAASYRRALELDPRLAEAWRGLGLVRAKAGDAAEARRAFTRYLELAPAAPDRAHVEAALRRLPGGTP